MSDAPLRSRAVAYADDGTDPIDVLPDWSEALAGVVHLSVRERQVFLMLGAGHSNRSIAARLRVTERTVKAHVAQVLSKLRVESRLQAGLVAHAYRVMNESPIHSQGRAG
ncbi:helix-turn-helix transcriptional regulator [Streptomyces sp. NEAU-sy36]|uniref:helix-turn-helix domain-containing protein n=1 Tax=unclassified Streptomyces TaxID=2593676 RepID=UPI0015D5B7A8|nr:MULTISPECIES: helix-turn-helix transcriptional regulator [unclassified Streptomyces]QLJ04527.1 helix-turn-helix transcriptional regulator [Streptomyces sp. NEAU-sy36]